MKTIKAYQNRGNFKGRTSDKPSKTIQGQAQTVKDLMVRYNNGQTVPMSKSLKWAEKDGEENIDINDLTDLDTYAHQIDQLEKARAMELKRLAKEKRKKEISEEINKLEAERLKKESEENEQK